MHPNMWQHAPIARNVEQLRADGAWVIEPGLGFTVGQRDMFVAAFISSAVFELTDSCARRLVLDKMTFRRAMPCRELAFE